MKTSAALFSDCVSHWVIGLDVHVETCPTSE